jgi:hypothetical protein
VDRPKDKPRDGDGKTLEPAPENGDSPRASRAPAEQRASERVPIGAPATVKWGDQEFSGFVEVVNVAGAFVATNRSPDLGDYVAIVFSLPGDPRPFRVRANVVCTGCPSALNPQRAGFGARFERPPVTLLEAIRGLDRGH